MPEIALFVEDAAHQRFLDALITRMARERGIVISLRWGNARHGHGAVIKELKQYLRDLQRNRNRVPDLVIAATDANCKGSARRKEVVEVLEKAGLPTIAAIPDPHIERWLLLDSQAFKAVFAQGCGTPDRKCERSRYKKQLIDAILKAGIVPSFGGGIEFTDDLIQHMDLERMAQIDDSFGRLFADLRGAFQGWTA